MTGPPLVGQKEENSLEDREVVGREGLGAGERLGGGWAGVALRVGRKEAGEGMGAGTKVVMGTYCVACSVSGTHHHSTSECWLGAEVGVNMAHGSALVVSAWRAMRALG